MYEIQHALAITTEITVTDSATNYWTNTFSLLRLGRKCIAGTMRKNHRSYISSNSSAATCTMYMLCAIYSCHKLRQPCQRPNNI